MKKRYPEGFSERDKKLAPRRTKYWCYGCDMNLIAPGSKCNVCGCRSEKRRLRK